MNNSKDKKVLKRIDDSIKAIDNNDFTIYFFVADCKNVPNGSIQYIYKLAKTLFDKGYNVKMLYQLENEYSYEELKEIESKEIIKDESRMFVGVGEWLGEEYMDIPHMNISKKEWKVSAKDFLFIPEVFSTLMQQTYEHKAPCKRIVILNNFDYVTEFIPFNDNWSKYGITDCVCQNERQSKLLKEVFPYTRCKILNPYITECFREPILPKKLIVNIISKKTEDVSKLMKLFYWKYPMYKFITFRDLRAYSQDKFSEYLKESAITIWVDQNTPFGYSALEAIRCGNIVIGKIPEIMPEWMLDKDDNLKDNGVWTYDINKIPNILAQVLGTWMTEGVPEILLNNIKETNTLYTKEQWDKNVDKLINEYILLRKKEMEDVKQTIMNKNNK